MAVIGDAFWLVVVAMMWGGTNPFIKQGGQGIEHIKKRNVVLQFLSELKFLVLNWKYMVPFVLNQMGSVVFYLTLASADISLAVPLTNSLTFIFTSISAKMLGEHVGNRETYLGMGLVLVGVSLCVAGKADHGH